MAKTQTDFSSILNLQVGSAPEPKAIPEGTYYGVIAKLPEIRKVTTKEGDKPVCSVTFALNEPGEDVDTDALSEAGGLMRQDGEPKTVRRDFWLDEESRYQFDRFLAGFGFTADSGKSYLDVFAELPGMNVQCYIEQRTYEAKGGGSRTVNEVKTAFARED